MEEEIWKAIPGFEGLYEASTLGRIKTLQKSWNVGRGGVITRREKVLTPIFDKDGYCKVSLYKNNRKKQKSVHRLVAQAFIPNLDNKPHVNHKDGDKTNNRADNLEWVTPAENVHHSIDTGLRKMKMLIDTNTGVTYSSVKEASDVLGININTLKSKLTGHTTNNTGLLYL